jgi:L-fuculose-phosphate aldolase
MIVRMDFDGSWHGDFRPSSEWRFHLDILRARKEVNAVVHAHPPHATALAIRGQDIPPNRYMIAVAGGATSAAPRTPRSAPRSSPTWRCAP